VQVTQTGLSPPEDHLQGLVVQLAGTLDLAGFRERIRHGLLHQGVLRKVLDDFLFGFILMFFLRFCISVLFDCLKLVPIKIDLAAYFLFELSPVDL